MGDLLASRIQHSGAGRYGRLPLARLLVSSCRSGSQVQQLLGLATGLKYVLIPAS